MGSIQDTEAGTAGNYRLKQSIASSSNNSVLGIPFHCTRNDSLPDDVALPSWEGVRDGEGPVQSTVTARSEHLRGFERVRI